MAVKIFLYQHTDLQRSEPSFKTPSGVKTVDWKFSKHVNPVVFIHHTPNEDSDQRGIFSSSCHYWDLSCLKQNSSPDFKRPPRGLKREKCFQLAPQREPQTDKEFIFDVLAVVQFFETTGGDSE